MPANRTPSPSSTAKTAEQRRVDRLADPEDATDVLGQVQADPDADTETLNKVDTTQPLEQRAGNGNLPALRDLDDMAAVTFDRHIRTLANLATVRREETARHARKTADIETVGAITGMLADAGAAIADLDHVPDELKARVAKEAAAWADGGAS